MPERDTQRTMQVIGTTPQSLDELEDWVYLGRLRDPQREMRA